MSVSSLGSKETLPMVRWEYLTIEFANLPASTDEVNVLNEAGEQGWELIAIMTNRVAYLRRPIDDRARATSAPAPNR